MEEFACVQHLSSSQAHGFRVVHQLPRRVRLRSHRGSWTANECGRLTAALRCITGVQTFRISRHSLTVHHSAPLQAVIDTVQRALVEPGSPHEGTAIAGPALQPVRQTDGSVRRCRRAGRQLLACALLGLAITLLPDPVAPAMIVVRLLACGATAAVRHHAQALARPCALTRLLDGVSWLVGLLRVDNIARALLKQCAEAVVKSWLQARLQPAIA